MRPDLHHDLASLGTRTTRVDHPDALGLLTERLSEWEATYGYGDPPDAEPADYRPPGGLFLIVYTPAGEPVACGGFRTLDAGRGEVEIAKMYVAPGWRRIGLGGRLLRRLEADARGRGATIASLETGARNVAAHSLYAASGYRSIESPVPGRLRMAKEL